MTYQSDTERSGSSEKFTRADERRAYAKCPCCYYSAPPHEHRAEYKHFNPHWLECDRCHWQTQTYPNFKHARWAWNWASAIEFAVQRAEASECFPSRSGLGEKVNFSDESERDAVSLIKVTSLESQQMSSNKPSAEDSNGE